MSFDAASNALFAINMTSAYGNNGNKSFPYTAYAFLRRT